MLPEETGDIDHQMSGDHQIPDTREASIILVNSDRDAR